VDALHFARDHEGCGHQWKVTATSIARFDLAQGRLAVSSEDLHAAVRDMIMPWWNRSLNDMLPGTNATPEGIAAYVLEHLLLEFPTLESVTVEASYGARVTARREIR
jgi:hypothetical protein